MQRTSCVARWASYAGGRAPGESCSDEATTKLGDAWFCDHHYNRALDAARAALRREREADESFGWNYESRRWDADASESVYYVLRPADSLIKIGYSAHIRTRLTMLRWEHGELELLLTHRGERDTEHVMHKRFKDLRVVGEWFQPGKPLVAWILEARRHQSRMRPPGLLPGTVPLADLPKMLRVASRQSKRSRSPAETATKNVPTGEDQEP